MGRAPATRSSASRPTPRAAPSHRGIARSCGHRSPIRPRWRCTTVSWRTRMTGCPVACGLMRPVSGCGPRSMASGWSSWTVPSGRPGTMATSGRGKYRPCRHARNGKTGGSGACARKVKLRDRGKLVGRPSFGYAVTGTKYDHTLAPTDEGREWVPRIFGWVIDGHNLATIAKRLDSAGVPAGKRREVVAADAGRADQEHDLHRAPCRCQAGRSSTSANRSSTA